jgi:hypothetical protein
MPFDGTVDPRQSYLLVKLGEVSEYLSSEDKWCKRQLHGPGGQRCLLGALRDADASWLLYQPVIAAARDVTGIAYHRIDSFNDAATTDFITVRAVLDRARADIVLGTAPRGLRHQIAYYLGAVRKQQPQSLNRHLALLLRLVCPTRPLERVSRREIEAKELELVDVHSP